jgi:hypothetical protein
LPWETIPPSPIPHVFDNGIWPLQQKKLNRYPALPLQGRCRHHRGGGAIGLGSRKGIFPPVPPL